MRIDVQLDKEDVKRLSRLPSREIPFATAYALTQLANKARLEVKGELPKKFIIRNRWTARGIITEQASKRDWPNVQSIIGSRDKYMTLQEEGGSKPVGDKAFSIPRGIRKNVRQSIGRKKWPGKILGDGSAKIPMGGRPKGAKTGTRSKPQPFIAIPKSKLMGIYVRTGRYWKFNGRRKEKYKMLWRLQSKPIPIKKREWLLHTVGQLVAKEYKNVFEHAVLRSIETMR